MIVRLFRLFVAISITSITADAPAQIQWKQSYELTSNTKNNLPKILRHSDTICIGGKKSKPYCDTLTVLRYTKQGEILSTLKCGIDTAGQNIIVDYEMDSSQNIYVLIQKVTGLYKSKALLEKYSPAGGKIWTTELASGGDTSYAALDLHLVHDTSAVVLARKEFDYTSLLPRNRIVVSAVRLNGKKLWQRTLAEMVAVYPLLFHHRDSIYVFDAHTWLSPTLVKINLYNAGTSVLNLNLRHHINSILFTKSNHLLISGFHDCEVTKLNLAGRPVWHKLFTPLPTFLGSRIAIMTEDEMGNIYLAGTDNPDSIFRPQMLITKVTPDGIPLWRYSHRHTGIEATATRMQIGGENIYLGGPKIVANPIDYAISLLKIDRQSGKLRGEFEYSSPDGKFEAFAGMSVSPTGEIVLNGLINDDLTDAWLTFYLKDVILENAKPITRVSGIYPNPAKSGSEIIITDHPNNLYILRDLQGKKIVQGRISSANSLQIPILASGLYFLELHDTSDSKVIKLFIE